MTIYTKEQAIAALDAVSGGDAENGHSEADDIIIDYLRSAGDAEIADAWHRVCGRYGGFWYA